jgi:signal transduction histidine kinase
VCCFPANVCQFFPRDAVLQDLKAESYVGTTLWGHTGNAIGLIAVIKRDKLENQKQAEELLKIVAVRAGGEMERIAAEEEIKHQNEELHKHIATKDKFFSIIAHDLRSPFNGFLGLTQIMAEELPSLTMAEIQEIAVGLRDSATNLFRLLENLLSWSRMQQGLIPFNPHDVQLLSIVEESSAILNESAKRKNIGLTYDISTDLSIFADSNLLQTVIRNLVSNAIKFTTNGGSVLVSARTVENRKVEISIKDSGIGISTTMVSDLFRLDSKAGRKGTAGEPSTGLGLMLCKEFVGMHGGTIWVKSEEGKGSVFSFTIPTGPSQQNT